MGPAIMFSRAPLWLSTGLSPTATNVVVVVVVVVVGHEVKCKARFHYIFIRQVSLPVDFRYFATY